MTKTNTIFTLSALLLCAGTSLVHANDFQTRESAVVDGKAATDSEFNSTVAILMLDEEGFATPHCTGTLIGPKIVLTASHCIRLTSDETNELERTLTIDDLAVVAGALDANTSTEEQTYYPDNIFYHDDFPSNITSDDPDGVGQDFDIALLVLDRDITSVPTAPILPMARFDDVLQEGKAVIITGYGNQGPSEDAEAGVLYIAETPYQRRGDFEFIAGGTGNPDTCPGDSGGPVYVQDGGKTYLIGASARSVESASATCGDGGIYTLVPAYMDWINTRVGEQLGDNGDNGDGGDGGDGGDNGGDNNGGGDNGDNNGGGDNGGGNNGDTSGDEDDGGCQAVSGSSNTMLPVALMLGFLALLGAFTRRSA